MIKANELRIGNWIQINNGERPPYNYEITAHDIEEIDGYGEDCFPIKLTPEILEKWCGFEKDSDAGNWHSPEHTIYKLKTKYFSVGIRGEYIGYYNQSEDDFYSSFFPQLKTLHQLQNFYFAYYSEELGITIPQESTA